MIRHVGGGYPRPMAAEVTWGRTERAIAAGLVAATALSVVALLVRGAGYVLDDWFVLQNAEFRGIWAAAGSEQGTARPGTYRSSPSSSGCAASTHCRGSSC